MGTYILRRALHSVFVVFGISAVVFLTLHLSGDPAALLAGPSATAEDIADLRDALGLNKPLYVQYWTFISHAIHGNFGQSFHFHSAAFPLVVERIPATIELASAAMLVAMVLAFPLGIISAVRRDGVIDIIARLIALFGVSFPSFWLGIVLILIVTVRLGLLPPSGRGGLSHLILPAVTLGLGQSATLMRLLRASMLEVLGADYIRTARAKGLRDALIPVVTVLGLQLGNLLGGAIIVEVVFAWPGMGQLAVEAIGDRDYALVQSVVVLLALIFVAINFAVDMIYVVLDPKIRLT